MISVPIIIILDILVKELLTSKFPKMTANIEKYYAVIAMLFFTGLYFLKTNTYLVDIERFISVDGLVLSVAFLTTISIVASKKEVRPKLVALCLLGINDFFMLSTIILSYFCWEKFKSGRHIKSLLALFSLSLGILLSFHWPYVGKPLVLTCVVVLISMEFDKHKKSSDYFLNSIMIGSIALSAGSFGDLVYLTLIPIIYLSIHLFRKYLVEDKSRLDVIFSILYIYALTGAYVGTKEMFLLFLGTIVLVETLIHSKLTDKNNVIWPFVLLFLSISPPFGLGYEFKTELIELSLSSKRIGTLLFLPILILLQFLTLEYFISRFRVSWPLLKEKKLQYDYLAILILALTLFIFLLFIPENWNIEWGSLFKKITGVASRSKNLSVGYYLFWIEIIFWFFLAVIYYKSPKDFLSKIIFRFKLNSLEAPILLRKYKTQSKNPYKKSIRNFVLGLEENPVGKDFWDAMPLLFVLLFLMILLGGL